MFTVMFSYCDSPILLCHSIYRYILFVAYIPTGTITVFLAVERERKLAKESWNTCWCG